MLLAFGIDGGATSTNASVLPAATLETREPRKNQGASKRVLIIGQLSRDSNGVKPLEIERFLRERGHKVELLNTYYLGRASSSEASVANKLPALTFKRFAIYVVEAISRVLVRPWKWTRRCLSYYTLIADCRLRRSFLRSHLRVNESI